MCGIFGVYARDLSFPGVEKLEEGLTKLEYRGYDSCGICVSDSNGNGELAVVKSVGAVSNLRLQDGFPKSGNVGIGHVRWATHGEITAENAHPHIFDGISVVHNGIVENISEVVSSLDSAGVQHGYTESSSDTSVIPALLSFLRSQHNGDLVRAFVAASGVVKGNSAIVALGVCSSGSKGGSLVLCCTAVGCSLYIGKSEGVVFVASDLFAMQACDEIYRLLDGDTVVVRNNSVFLVKRFTGPASGDVSDSGFTDELVFLDIPFEKNSIPSLVSVPTEDVKAKWGHITRGEIQEQISISDDIVSKYVLPTIASFESGRAEGVNNFPSIDGLNEVVKVNFVASGSSLNAGYIVSKFIERTLGLETGCYFGSEFGYISPAMPTMHQQLCVFISQSGETLDSIISIKRALELEMKTIGILNMPYSTMGTMLPSNVVCPGTKEIGVAATKSFTSQVLMGLLLAVHIGLKRGSLDVDKALSFLSGFKEVSDSVAFAISLEDEIIQIARKIASARVVQFVGRGVSYGLAMEGSLKMKELSYLQCEAIFAGELKHGHLAVVDKTTWCVCPLLVDDLFGKTIGNLHEIVTRGGSVLAVVGIDPADNEADGHFRGLSRSGGFYKLSLPFQSWVARVISINVVQQLLSYHVANFLDREIDKPRNLAKSITVE